MHECTVGGLKMQNPVMTAAGTVGFGASYADYYDLNLLGALVLRSITLRPCPGDPNPRLCEAPSGLLNRVGVANPGMEKFFTLFYNKLSELTTPVVASLWGTPAEIAEMAEAMSGRERIAALEINLYVPYEQFRAMGADAYRRRAADCVGEARAHFPGPVFAKLLPSALDPLEAARLAADSGASAVTVANSYWGMTFDPLTGGSRLGSTVGGLSGPCIRPLSVFHVYRIVQQTGMDVIGCGGIVSADSAREYLCAGAKAVQIGSGCFSDPTLAKRVINELSIHQEGIT